MLGETVWFVWEVEDLTKKPECIEMRPPSRPRRPIRETVFALAIPIKNAGRNLTRERVEFSLSRAPIAVPWTHIREAPPN